ncbi:MAG: glutathione S-transferase family protein [Alphaproteobacteria bacterium]|nr:glutathione S-transferase family protein [Alphaproteobacteria bacterium]
MLTLYHTPLSPYCRKIRMLLKEKDLAFELKNENVWDRRREFFTLNPAGEIPVLVAEDGNAICHSNAICEYLEEVYPEHNFLGETPQQRAEVRRITGWFDTKFENEVTQNLLFEKIYKRLWQYGQPSSEAIRAGKKNITYHLDYIAFLTKDRQWLAGDKITVADMAAAAHLSALDYLGDVPWSHAPDAKEWYALIKSRPSFRHILMDRVMGVKPPSHYENPDF